ncbi:MAG: pyridoxamine 5'-phosphate oxidase [Thioalkalivibrionaceae bacterium]
MAQINDSVQPRPSAATHDHRADRRRYLSGALDRNALNPDPFNQLETWIQDARTAGNTEPTAMILATADASGQPSARCVLLKHVDHGLCFYTDRDSRKGHDLSANPRAAVLFYWPETERQVRFEGGVEILSDAEADAYFSSRPTGSQQAAYASKQSQPIADRATLEAAHAAIVHEFPDGPPRPSRWGGYRLVPQRIEFWQGRDNRLHDRLQLDRTDSGWKITRLQP